jgi:ubiquinone/menaquinone biosynthesis C-methylase UbiE
MFHDTSYLARDFARFYDWTCVERNEDIPFYLTLARKHGAPLLELACGTGRVTIPLARQGFAITGIDISPEMLAITQEKLNREIPEVRARVRLLQADMTAFDLPDCVNLAFIPVASFFHLHHRGEKRRCLSSVRRHLSPRGVLAVDLIPDERMAHQAVGETITVRTAINPGTGKLTKELNRKLSISEQDQRVIVEHAYVETEVDGSESHHVFVEDYTWVTEAEMKGLLREVGFADVSVVGGYALQPYSDTSERMIFLAINGNEHGRG